MDPERDETYAPELTAFLYFLSALKPDRLSERVLVRPGPEAAENLGQRGRTLVVTVTGGHNKQVSLAALIATRPGRHPCPIYCTDMGERRDDCRQGFTETDYAPFLDVVHWQLNGPAVLFWDNLNTHTGRAMRELISARFWLTVYQLPPYASELNPVEAGWSKPETVTGQPHQAE